jgi:hypothetical protein
LAIAVRSASARVRPARRGSLAGRAYAGKGDPKYERAALKYLARYLTEGGPSLADFAQMAALLAERSVIMRGL